MAHNLLVRPSPRQIRLPELWKDPHAMIKTPKRPSKTAAKPGKKKVARKASHKKSAPTALLEKQHRKVEAIFKKLENGRAEAAPLLTELANNLAAHMAIEQEIYYPAAKKVDDDLVLESYEEHSLAELGLKRLLATSPRHESFKARVTAVKEIIEHHVEEEEDELFPHVDKKLDGDTLATLGERMEERFAEVLKAGFRKSVPKTYDETSRPTFPSIDRRRRAARSLPCGGEADLPHAWRSGLRVTPEIPVIACVPGGPKVARLTR